MERKFNISTIIKVASHTRYLPSIMWHIKNWPAFLLHYLGFKKGGAEYIFRNGIRIKTKDAVSTATVAVIFIKKDYGSVPQGSVVIDIGANIGVYSIFAGQRGATVYAFEPVAENFSLLRENVELNRMEGKIFPFCLGVAGSGEKRKIYLGESPFHSFLPVKESPFNVLYGNGSGQGQDYSEISCISLKDVFDRNNISFCDILKMDCEGAEYEILYNLADDYFRRIKKIRLEYHNHKNNPKNLGNHLVKFLEKKGFSIEKKKEASPHQGDLWLKK